MSGHPGNDCTSRSRRKEKKVRDAGDYSALFLLTSEVLANRESTVDIEAVDGAFGLGGRILQAQRRRQHGLLTLPSSIQLLLIQRLREAEHEEGREEE